MVARANRTTKDNLCSFKEKNLFPNHWGHHLGETACKKNTQVTIGKMPYEVVFGIAQREKNKKPQMIGQVTATSHAEQENGE